MERLFILMFSFVKGAGKLGPHLACREMTFDSVHRLGGGNQNDTLLNQIYFCQFLLQFISQCWLKECLDILASVANARTDANWLEHRFSFQIDTRCSLKSLIRI